MPSASSKTSVMSTQVPSIEGQDPIKVIVSMMEKKVRNLEKRKTKLVSYTQQVQDGKELVEKEQQDAVKKLELVENNLEFTKEFQQIFKIMEQEHLKLQKKEHKRAKVEMKEKNNEERKSLVIQVLEVQTILDNLDDEAKVDFQKGANGAVKLSEEELKKLDGIYKLITPNQCEETEGMAGQVSQSAEHLQSLLDEKDKPVMESTYKEIYGIVKKIKDCKYFEKNEEPEAPAEEAAPQKEGQSAKEDAQVEVPAENEADSSETPAESSDDVAEESEVRGAEVYSEVPSDHVAAPLLEGEVAIEEPTPASNGVDLPSEFSEAVADSALNFMGESEVENRVAAGEEGKLNAASPEFIPRSLQGVPSQDAVASSGSGWDESGEWQDVQQPHQSNRSRGGARGRDRGGYRGSRDGRGGRGRGGYGQNGPSYYRQDRPDFRRDGARGGPRGGNQRGGRGGPRGSSRGGQPRGGSVRGHHPQHQTQQ